MAKLSVYNTIDRSQLGGKFVPLIQSGVSNYKILASDLGKEYHPGDAIEITDTGEINVKFSPGEFSVSSEGLTIKTDAARGVFKGSDGIYIASADSTINVSISGIKVNRSNLVSRISGAGLKAVGEMIDVNSADDTIDVGMDGIRVNTSALSIPNAHSLAGSGLESVDSNKLYVKPANGSISVSSSGVKVDASFLAGHYLSVGPYNHNIIVDTASVARAITGSGLVTTNGAIGVNVNTATGIIVNDNKLYLNAGAGLYTTNNTVKVKSSNNTISVHSEGISVNTSSIAGDGLAIGDNSIYVGSADSTINVSGNGIRVNYGSGLNLDEGRLSVYCGSGLIKDATGALVINSSSLAGDGLTVKGDSLYVQSADNTIGVGSDGIKVNSSALAGSIAGQGLEKKFNTLYVKSADNTIDVGADGVSVYYGSGLRRDTDNNGQLSVYLGSGLYFNELGAICTNGVEIPIGPGLAKDGEIIYIRSSDNSIGVSHSGINVNLESLAGEGLETDGNSIYIKSADDTISVSSSGIRVNTSSLSIPASSLAGQGLQVGPGGSSLYVKSADDTINVSSSGISVNKSALSIPTAGRGLHSYGDALYVKSADNTIGVSEDGIRVNTSNLSHSLPGKGLYSDNGKISIYTDSAILGFTSTGALSLNNPGWGLEMENGTYYVKSADNTIDVSHAGIKVNTSALSIPTASSLAGDGLIADGSSIYVKSADSFINSSSSGVGLNVSNLYSHMDANSSNIEYNGSLNTIVAKSDTGAKITSLYSGSGIMINDSGSIDVKFDGSTIEDGLEVRNNSLYVKSADNTIGVTDAGVKVNTGSVAAAILGQGLEYNSGKLNVYCGSGLAIDAESGKLYVTSDASNVGKGLYVPSGSSRISVYAGSGLMFDTTNRVSVYAGSGLTLVGPEGEGPLQVKAGSKNTISVLDDGIEVNAGPGLCYAGSLYIQSADNSINVATDGITVNYGDGLFMNGASKLAVNAGSGLQVSEVEKKLTVYAGSGLGFDTYGDSLEVKNADGSISVTSDGIKVTEGFGLPDYSSAVTATQDTEYTADANCWLYMQVYSWSNSSGGSVNKSIVIDGVTVAYLSSFWYSVPSIMVPCKKGSVYKFKNSQTGEGSYTFKVYKCLK